MRICTAGCRGNRPAGGQGHAIERGSPDLVQKRKKREREGIAGSGSSQAKPGRLRQVSGTVSSLSLRARIDRAPEPTSHARSASSLQWSRPWRHWSASIDGAPDQEVIRKYVVHMQHEYSARTETWGGRAGPVQGGALGYGPRRDGDRLPVTRVDSTTLTARTRARARPPLQGHVDGRRPRSPSLGRSGPSSSPSSLAAG